MAEVNHDVVSPPMLRFTFKADMELEAENTKQALDKIAEYFDHVRDHGVGIENTFKRGNMSVEPIGGLAK